MKIVIGDENNGPSPESEFLIQPDNMTLPEGHMAVMKCKVCINYIRYMILKYIIIINLKY